MNYFSEIDQLNKTLENAMCSPRHLQELMGEHVKPPEINRFSAIDEITRRLEAEMGTLGQVQGLLPEVSIAKQLAAGISFSASEFISDMESSHWHLSGLAKLTGTICSSSSATAALLADDIAQQAEQLKYFRELDVGLAGSITSQHAGIHETLQALSGATDGLLTQLNDITSYGDPLGKIYDNILEEASAVLGFPQSIEPRSILGLDNLPSAPDLFADYSRIGWTAAQGDLQEEIEIVLVQILQSTNDYNEIAPATKPYVDKFLLCVWGMLLTTLKFVFAAIITYEVTFFWPETREQIINALSRQEQRSIVRKSSIPISRCHVVITGKGSLRLRSEPGTKSEVIDQLPLGTLVCENDDEETKRNWIYVDAYLKNNSVITGWVSKRYLTEIRSH